MYCAFLYLSPFCIFSVSRGSFGFLSPVAGTKLLVCVDSFLKIGYHVTRVQIPACSFLVLFFKLLFLFQLTTSSSKMTAIPTFFFLTSYECAMKHAIIDKVASLQMYHVSIWGEREVKKCSKMCLLIITFSRFLVVQ